MKGRVFLSVLLSLGAPLSAAHAALTAVSQVPNGPEMPVACSLSSVPLDPCSLGCIAGLCFPQPQMISPGDPIAASPHTKISGTQVDFRFRELSNPYDEDDNFCFELAEGTGINTGIQLRCRLPEDHHRFNPTGTGEVRLEVSGLENDGRLYCWRMKNLATTGWVAPKCFRNGPPAPPNLGDPEDSYNGHGENVSFHWSSGSPEGVVTRWEIDVEPNVGNCDGTNVGPGHTCGTFANIGETYAWSVKACDSDNECTSSNVRTFVNGEVPDQPTNPTITDLPTSTQFEWGPGPASADVAGKPTYYLFWLTAEGGGASNSAHGCPTSESAATNQQIPSAVPGANCTFTESTGGTYRWHIRACNLRGCGNGRSGTYTKSADEVLPPINLTELDNGDHANFSWQANPSGLAPDDYEFWVQPANGHDCETDAGPDARTGGPGAVCNFENGGGYTWFVSACDEDGCSAPASRSFNKELVLPDNPQGLTTTGGCTDIGFQWNAGEGPPPTEYVFSLTSLDGFVPIDCVSAELSGTSYICNDLDSGATYEWTVQACRSDGCREPGITSSFTVSAPEPSMPVLVWPPNAVGETTGFRPDEDFEWTPSLHASHYRLEVLEANPGYVCNETTTGTSFSACPNLPADGTWLGVRVTAISSCGEQTQSAPRFLRSLPEVVIPGAPSVDDAGSEMTFQWANAAFEGPSELTLSYQLEVLRRKLPSDPLAPLSGSPFLLPAPPGGNPSLTLGESDGIEYKRWDYEFRVVAVVEGGNPSSPVQLGEAQAETPWRSHEAGPRFQPGAPRLRVPGRGQAPAGTSVALEWDVGTNAEYHEIYVFDPPTGPALPSCNGRFSDAIGLDGTQTTVCPGLSNDGGLYYWFVSACNDFDADGDDECTESPVWFFYSGVADETGDICPMP